MNYKKNHDIGIQGVERYGRFPDRCSLDFTSESIIAYAIFFCNIPNKNFKKALMILADDRKIQMKQGAYEILMEGIKSVRQKKNTEAVVEKAGQAAVNVECMKGLPVQINVVVRDETSMA